MNKKLLALAVSAAVAAPVASQAADVTLYGRVNNAIDIKDIDGGDSTTDLSGIVSRFGIRASSDIGNGLTASARFEFGVASDRELSGAGTFGDTRIGTVGISGGFGSFTVGNQWSAYYDTVGTHIDPTYTLGYYLYSSFVGGPYRASNTIKYSNSFGPVYLEIDARLNESEEGTDIAEVLNGDGGGIGISINPVDGLTLAVAFDSEDQGAGTDDAERTGFAAKWSSGGFFVMVGYQETEVSDVAVDNTSIYVGGDLGGSTSLLLGLQSASDDGGRGDADQFIVGVYHNIGGGLKFYYEGTSLDYDVASSSPLGDDFTRHLLGMRIDF